GERLQNFYVITDGEGRFKGIVSSSNLLAAHHDEKALVETLIKRQPFSIKATDSLKNAVEMMAQENTDVLPVVNGPDKTVVGILSYQEILSVYRERSEDHRAEISISLRRRTLKILLHGKKRLSVLRTPKMNGSDG